MAGSIEKRGENKYRLVVSSGFDANGKRIKHTKTIEAPSRLKAEKELALFIAEIEKGQYIKPSKFTFKEYSEKWLSDYAKLNLELKTYSTYVDIINNRFIPEFGQYRLEQIKPLKILDFYKKLSEDGARQDGKKGGLSAKTIRNYHNLLNSMFKHAVRWQLVISNPVERIEPPKSKKPKISFYTDEQTMDMMKILSEQPIKYKTLIMVCIYMGVRRGEALGLQWKNIDFENQIFNVSKTINYDKSVGIFEKEPKTDTGTRKISFPNTLKDLLIEYKNWQEEQKELMGELWIDNDLLFTQVNGKPMHPDTPSQWFTKFISENNLPHITLHGLRHTNPSLLIASGMDLQTISSRLGHADPNFTVGTYGHMFEKTDKIASDKIEDILNGNAKEN